MKCFVSCVSVMLHTKSSAWRRAGYPNVSEQKEKEKEREKEKEKEILTHPPPYWHWSTLSCFVCREYKGPGTDLGQTDLKFSSSAAIQNQYKVHFLQKLLAVWSLQFQTSACSFRLFPSRKQGLELLCVKRTRLVSTSLYGISTYF